MNNIASGQIFKVSIGLLIISTVMMLVMSTLRKLFTKNKKRAFLYALFILLTFGLTGLLSYEKVLDDSPINSFYGFQVMFVILGMVHVYVMRKFFPDLSQEERGFWPEFVFTIIYLAVGLIVFINIVGRFKEAFSVVFMGAAIFFIVPFLVYRLYEYAYMIPLPIYKSWTYPLGKEIKDPTKEELSNPRVISFEFRKSPGSSDITNFRVKAPQRMEFGKLFFFFLLDYNERHPESTIQFLDDQTQQPFDWVFHFKPKWWSPVKHINFDLTIEANNIKEDAVVICRRTQGD